MILKSFQLNNLDISNKNNLILFYGENQGFKEEEIKKILKKNINKTIQTFEEREILDQVKIFYETIFTKSLFENERIIVINRATDKLITIMENLLTRNISDTTIILNSSSLQKKSKLRSLFEKNKKMLCVPFYADNQQTLSKLAQDFVLKNKIVISNENINLITDKCNGDRGILKNELSKIKIFAKNKKNISKDNLLKLINLLENYSITELADYFFLMNKKKIRNILSENNYNAEDCVTIIRTFLIKSKNILRLSKEFEKNKNLDLTISSAKPPIFWKDKVTTKNQLIKWNSRSIKELIYDLNDLELTLKKNFSNSLYILTNFLLSETHNKVSN